MELNQYLLGLLQKKQKNYITLRFIRDTMPKALLNSHRLTKNSSLRMVRKAFEPYLSEDLICFEGRRTVYLGQNLGVDEIILNKLCQNPHLSSKQLQNRLPFKNVDFIGGLNKLLKEQKVTCELHSKTHTPKLFALKHGSQKWEKRNTDSDEALFRAAFHTVGQGRQFVRIHEIRDFLNWPKDHFDSTLERLKSNLAIQLQGGDPKLLTKEELEKSYTDTKERLRIIVNWIDNG